MNARIGKHIKPVRKHLVLLLAVAAVAAWFTPIYANSPALPNPGKFGCIDISGQIVVPIIYQKVSCGGGVIIARIGDTNIVLLTRDGKPITSVHLEGVGFDTEGKSEPAAFSFGPEPAKVGNRWGYIDRGGNFVVAPKYEDAGPFSPDELAPVRIGGKWGFINRIGDVVIAPSYDEAEQFSVSGLAAVKQSGHWGYINLLGQISIPVKFDRAGPFDGDGYAFVTVSGRTGILDIKGKYVLKPIMDYIRSFNTQGNAFAVASTVKDDLKTHTAYHIDRKGRLTELKMPPGLGPWPDGITFLGLQVFRKNPTLDTPARYGYLDADMHVVLSAQYDDAWDFSANGLAAAEKDGKWGYIDKDGRFVIAPQFDNALPFGDGELAPIEQGHQWGYIDRAGRISISPKFNSACAFEKNGLARVELERPDPGYLPELMTCRPSVPQ